MFRISKYIKLLLKYIVSFSNSTYSFVFQDDYTKHRRRGYSFFIKKEYDKAIEEYKIALELRPYNIDPHIELSRLYCNKDNIPNALSYAKKAVELADDSFIANDNLAYVYIKDLKFKDAILVLEKFLTIKLNKEQFITLHNMLGYASIFTGNDAVAENYLFKVLEIDPENAKSLYNLAILSCRSGKEELASEYLQKILKYHPEYSDVYDVKMMLEGIKKQK